MMIFRVFRGADPFVQLIVLFLLSFFCVAVTMLMAYGLVRALWGIDLMTNPLIIQDYTNPQIMNVNRLLLLFQHIGLFIIPSLVFAKMVSDRPANYLMLSQPPPPAFVWAAMALMLLGLVPVNFLAGLNERLHFPESLASLEAVIRSMEDSAAELTQGLIYVDSPMLLVVNIGLLALIPAIGEELLFRGVVMKILVRWTGNIHAGVWISAVVFSALHFQFFGFLPRVLMGAVLGYLVVWSGSLIPSMIAHFLNNALAVTVAYLSHKGVIAEGVDDIGAMPEHLWISLGATAIFVAAMAWTSRMSHWNVFRQDYLYGE